jgi:hypothetical protein
MRRVQKRFRPHLIMLEFAFELAEVGEMGEGNVISGIPY